MRKGEFQVDVFGEDYVVLMERYADLDAALEAMVPLAFPPRPNIHVHLVDSNCVSVLGYSSSPVHVERVGSHGWWHGVAEAFAALELVHDPMECAIWEMMAKRAYE